MYKACDGIEQSETYSIFTSAHYRNHAAECFFPKKKPQCMSMQWLQYEEKMLLGTPIQ
jgi:hypothetical protein